MAKRKTTKSKTFSKETYLEWYELMLRIRKFEERANLMYFQKKIRGFLHLYDG
jgi:pyruvate dehydrogenase E1 component alpha subunit